MKRNIISLILDAVLFVLWSIVGIGRAVTEPSWLCLIYGGLMTIYFVTTVNDIRYIIKLVKEKNSPKETKSEENN